MELIRVTRPAAILSLWLATVAAARADLYLQGVGGDHARAFRHDRFYEGPDRDFIGEELDWSGVGRATDPGGTKKWLVMISPVHFLSAYHYHPQSGASVTFYPGNSTNAFHTYTVDSWGRRTTYEGLNSDLWLGRLTSPLDPSDGIAVYPIFVLPEDDDYLGREIWVYGRPHRVGRNTIDAIADNYETGKARVLEFIFDASGGVGEDEAYLMSGDSGAPTFVVHRGRLAVVGTHFTNEGAPADGKKSGDSFVPFYLGQLRGWMKPYEPAIVPAPTTLEVY